MPTRLMLAPVRSPAQSSPSAINGTTNQSVVLHHFFYCALLLRIGFLLVYARLGHVTCYSKITTKLNEMKPTGTRDFNVENPSNKEEKKPRAPAGNTSLFRGEVTNAPGFTMCGLSPAAAYKTYL